MQIAVVRGVRCPYEKECTSSAGFCHRWKHQTFTPENGRLVLTTLIYECNKPLKKV